ncbi:MAG: ATP-binding cassette domain-containing protein [Chitinivibrionales bacterium]|nr:ATP-binding cassette domain-containing protein [Chitinivibrionales bacterium]
MNDSYLSISNLTTTFPVFSGFIARREVGSVKAVVDVSLDIGWGEVVGLVGESGCGKSTLARSVMRLVEPDCGQVLLDGADLTGIGKRELRTVRPDIQIIFQDPYASLNPRMTVYDAVKEAFMVRRQFKGTVDRRMVIELMERVGLAPRYIRKYPHEFSGGQRQRIAIARALALEPKVIIADEPVSALDVSVQAQILNLLEKLRREMQLTMIFISHDLSVVKHIADRIAVMYLGRIVELGPADEVFARPRHPYTKALISAAPSTEVNRPAASRRIILSGDPPSPMNPPSGCPFHPRCRYAQPACKEAVPALDVYHSSNVACIRVAEINN